MIRASKLRRPKGYSYVRYCGVTQPLDGSTRTKRESQAQTCRLRGEIEINAGIQPLRHGDVAELIDQPLAAMPPQTSDSHRGEALRILKAFLRICGTKRRDGSVKLRTGQLTPELVDRFIVRPQRYQLYDGTRRSILGRRVVGRKPVSNITLRKELRYLSGFFNRCRRQRPPYLRDNPIPLSNAAAVKSDEHSAQAQRGARDWLPEGQARSARIGGMSEAIGFTGAFPGQWLAREYGRVG